MSDHNERCARCSHPETCSYPLPLDAVQARASVLLSEAVDRLAEAIRREDLTMDELCTALRALLVVTDADSILLKTSQTVLMTIPNGAGRLHDDESPDWVVN